MPSRTSSAYDYSVSHFLLFINRSLSRSYIVPTTTFCAFGLSFNSTFPFTYSTLLLTIKMILKAPLAIQMDVPSILNYGTGTPVTGPNQTATSIFASACIVKLNPKPAAKKAPNARGLKVTIRIHRYINATYRKSRIAPPIVPYSSTITAKIKSEYGWG